MYKKILVLILSLVMLLTIFAGCSSEPEAASPSNGDTDLSSEDVDNGGQETGDDLEVVSLRLIFYGDMTSRRQEYFSNEFHEAVLEDLKIDLSMEFMPWGSDVNIATMLASGEAFAIENIVANYDWPSKGYLAEIDEALIQERLPNLISTRGENNGFECVKYDGKIYAIPFGNKPYSGSLQHFDVREDILDELGYTAGEITTLEKLEEVYAAVNEAYPDMRIVMNEDFLRPALHYVLTDGQEVSADSGMVFAYVNELEDGDTVYSYYESEAFKNLCAVTKRWAELGYIQMDEITDPLLASADWDNANCFSRNGMPGALISETLKTANPDAVETLVKIGDFPNIKINDYDWGISISKNDADNVPRWLDLFDWIYQDQDHFNFCVYGVENKDWEYNDDGTINKLVTDAFFDSWFLEAIPYNIYNSAIPQETIERYENFDNGSQMSKKSGFSFDTTPVASEFAMLTSVYDEKIWPMYLGFLDYDENIDSVIQEMKNAGIDTYMEEYQRQFSEFYAANN